MLLLDPAEIRRIKDDRAEAGVDRFDEVWDGVYVVGPVRDIEHQWITGQLGCAFHDACPKMYLGCNVSDRRVTWRRNFRIPDVVVFLPDNPGEDCDTHWFGGPDFVVEVATPGDRSRDKLGFYSKVGVREVLIVDRKPWQLELYRHDGTALTLAGGCTPAKNPKALASQVIPFRFALTADRSRPTLLVTCNDGIETRIFGR